MPKPPSRGYVTREKARYYTTEHTLIAYRAQSLLYGYSPLSTEGSRSRGGRFNKPGVGAVYLSECPLTAYLELQSHVLTKNPIPCLMVAVEVTMRNYVDLTRPGILHHGCWTNWNTDWETASRLFETDKTATCDSWKCSDAVIKNLGTGIRFPSVANPGNANLVPYPEMCVHGTLTTTLIDPGKSIEKVWSKFK